MDIISEQSLRHMWDDLAELYNDKTALIFEDLAGKVRQYSYLELNGEINRTANLFTSLGLQKGDPVALHLNNSVEFILCWFGLAKMGAVMVPINTHLLTDECACQILATGALMVVTTHHFSDIYQKIKNQPDISLQHILIVDHQHNDHVDDSPCPFNDECHFNDYLYFNQLLKEQSPIFISNVPVSCHDTAEILFTSGTTSRPKGVVITHYNLRFAGYYTAWQCALRSDDIYLTCMPAYHIDCQCTAAMAAFSVGATFVLLEKFSARAFWHQVYKYRATITECIPLMMRTMMMQPQQSWEKDHCLREVFFYLTLSESEKNAFIERFNVRLLTSYGMTETIVGIIGDRPGDKRRWPSIGRVGFCYQAKIIDSEGNTLPPGKIGEITVKGIPGKTIFKEYYNCPQTTQKTLSVDGWIHTGDSGYVDEEGFFYFVDRNINMIKRCGENISCIEIENLISAHPKVAEVAVIGLKDSIRDESIKAFVILKEGEELNEWDLLGYCAENMAKFKVPSFIEFRDSLPRTSTGKVKKKNLY